MASSPKVSKAIRRLLSLPTFAERQYEIALAGLFARVHRSHGVHQDSVNGRDIRRAAGVLFDRMSKQVKHSNDRNQKLLGISYTDIGLAPKIQKFREQNLDLIQNAADDFIDDVDDVLEDPEFELAEDVAQAIKKKAGTSISRARLIARDQTLKLNAAITQHRQKNSGIEKYEWSTSLDERVRPLHARLEGKIFSWDNPPVTTDDGDTNHPGEDIQCRCVAVPVLDDAADVDEVDDED